MLLLLNVIEFMLLKKGDKECDIWSIQTFYYYGVILMANVESTLL